MKRFKNERGAALILVLFGITLAMLFIMFQMGQLISTKTQVTSAEKNIDSKNITKMAAERYKKEVGEKLGSEDGIHFGVTPVDEITTEVVDIGASLNDIKKLLITEVLDDNHSYTIKTLNYDSANQVLKFEVIGEAYKKRTIWNGIIKINQK